MTGCRRLVKATESTHADHAAAACVLYFRFEADAFSHVRIPEDTSRQTKESRYNSRELENPACPYRHKPQLYFGGAMRDVELSFLKCCLPANPAQCSNADSLLQHPYFDGLRPGESQAEEQEVA